MKIGAAIIACDRIEYTKQCVASLMANKGILNEIILVNDGLKIPDEALPESIHVIENTPPYQTVGKAKNKALRYLINAGCDHIFLIENDIIIKSPDVWQKYIDAAEASGITHLNFGYHGPANRSPDYKKPSPRYIVEYPGGTKIALNAHSVGAFSYFNPIYIKKVGLHDEYFKNAWEHVELCQRGIKAGLLPAFWWFPDVQGSDGLLTEITGSIHNSSITHTETWTTNMRKGADYYRKQHGVSAIENPDTSLNEVLSKLKIIFSNRYSNQ
jgi:GT2 family glycosyltransferase